MEDVSYDYIEIVVDDDWKLFGIVPNTKPMPPEAENDDKIPQISATVINTPKNSKPLPIVDQPSVKQVTQAEIFPKHNPNNLEGLGEHKVATNIIEPIILNKANESTIFTNKNILTPTNISNVPMKPITKPVETSFGNLADRTVNTKHNLLKGFGRY